MQNSRKWMDHVAIQQGQRAELVALNFLTKSCKVRMLVAQQGSFMMMWNKLIVGRCRSMWAIFQNMGKDFQDLIHS